MKEAKWYGEGKEILKFSKYDKARFKLMALKGLGLKRKKSVNYDKGMEKVAVSIVRDHPGWIVECGFEGQGIIWKLRKRESGLKGGCYIHFREFDKIGELAFERAKCLIHRLIGYLEEMEVAE